MIAVKAAAVVPFVVNHAGGQGGSVDGPWGKKSVKTIILSTAALSVIRHTCHRYYPKGWMHWTWQGQH